MGERGWEGSGGERERERLGEREIGGELCWVRAASGPFFGEQFIST